MSDKTDNAIMLALQAQTDVLTKMNERNERLEKAEKEEEDEAIEKAARAEFTKGIVNDVLKAIGDVTGESPQGMDVDGASKEDVSGDTKWPLNDNDSGPTDKEQPTDVRSGTDEVGKVIQASADGRDVNEEEGEASGKFSKEESEEYPHEEDDYDGDEVKALAKRVATLTKAVTNLAAGGTGIDLQKAVERGMEKVGYKKADALQVGKVRLLGDDGSSFLSKSAGEATPEDLKDLSYSDIAQMEIASGKYKSVGFNWADQLSNS